jgi:hypothetical protein
VFVLNDWSGMSADLQDPNRASSDARRQASVKPHY